MFYLGLYFQSLDNGMKRALERLEPEAADIEVRAEFSIEATQEVQIERCRVASSFTRSVPNSRAGLHHLILRGDCLRRETWSPNARFYILTPRQRGNRTQLEELHCSRGVFESRTIWLKAFSRTNSHRVAEESSVLEIKRLRPSKRFDCCAEWRKDQSADTVS